MVERTRSWRWCRWWLLGALASVVASDAAFDGRVLSITREERAGLDVRMSVDAASKGVTAGTEVHVATTLDLCIGARMVVGARYRVYARRTSSGALQTDVCSTSMLAPQASASATNGTESGAECDPEMSVEAARMAADVVALGDVVAFRSDAPGRHEVVLDVQRVWKGLGPSDRRTTVTGTFRGGVIPLGMLVFASRRMGALSLVPCGRSHFVRGAADADLVTLGASLSWPGAPPAPRPVPALRRSDTPARGGCGGCAIEKRDRPDARGYGMIAACALALLLRRRRPLPGRS